MPDLYEVLQVHPRAEPEVLRAAYRVLARKCHPDHGGDARRMITLNDAWDVLGDPVRRAAYDASRRRRLASSGPNSNLRRRRRHPRPPSNVRRTWPTPVRRRDDPPEPSWTSADTPAGRWVRLPATTWTTSSGSSGPLWGVGCAPRLRCSSLRAAGPGPLARPPIGRGVASGRVATHVSCARLVAFVLTYAQPF